MPEPIGIKVVTKNVPDDVMEILLEKQGKLKSKCKCQQSYQTTIYKILRFMKDKNIGQ